MLVLGHSEEGAGMFAGAGAQPKLVHSGVPQGCSAPALFSPSSLSSEVPPPRSSPRHFSPFNLGMPILNNVGHWKSLLSTSSLMWKFVSNLKAI